MNSYANVMFVYNYDMVIPKSTHCHNHYTKQSPEHYLT